MELGPEIKQNHPGTAHFGADLHASLWRCGFGIGGARAHHDHLGDEL
jgi:hypothetical protein